jgi:hypothetical protein
VQYPVVAVDQQQYLRISQDPMRADKHICGSVFEGKRVKLIVICEAQETAREAHLKRMTARLAHLSAFRNAT